MALAMTPAVTSQDDVMDIDIDMDVDETEPIVQDEQTEQGEHLSYVPPNAAEKNEIPAIYLEDPAQEPQWEKIHLRGVDELSTDHIRTFATGYFPDAEPHVQWIDDTSANLVYKDSKTARQAMLALLASASTSEDIAEKPLELRQAKALISHPASILTLRVAMVSDRKRKNAKDASRYYLMHPEADPTERMRREFAAGRPGRGENGDYRRRRFDEREHRRRRDQDHAADSTNDFEASMYDDAPAEKNVGTRGRDLFSRIRKTRRRSASPTGNIDAMSVSDSEDDNRHRRRRNGYRNRDSPPPYSRHDPNAPSRSNVGKELFGGSGIGGSGMRSDNADLFPAKRSHSTGNARDTSESQRQTNFAAARRLKADLLASTSSLQTPSPSRTHRRSRAMDSRVEEDLAERFGRKSISMDSTKSVTQPTANAGKELFAGDNVNSGFSIKGSASINQGFSIKGRADAQAVKELFPEQYNGAGRNGNAGKELFDQPVRSRGARQRAGDLFD